MHKEMESSVFFSIFQLMQFMKYQGMKRMEELDIKPSQAGILFSLKCWGEQSQRQLAQRVGITPPSMTVALRKMEEKGYVSRKTDEKDQRITRIQLAALACEYIRKYPDREENETHLCKDKGAATVKEDFIIVRGKNPIAKGVKGSYLFLLKEEKMIVTKAWNGREAVEIFENSEPGYFDVILMDLMMPVMDGYTATRKIRELERSDAKTVPIIAMTANAFQEDAEKCIAVGMNAHLAKPLDIEKVMITICHLVK